MAWDRNEEYFTGQGSVLISDRTAGGQAVGFRHFGNVSALAIATARNYNVHKESKSGNRATDRRTISETNVTMSATCENFSSENIAAYTTGLLTKVAAGTVTGQKYIGTAGLVTAFDHIQVSALDVKAGATSLVAYTNDATAWDYKVNLDAGSILLNAASTKLAATVTDVLVGTKTTITAVIGYVKIGDTVTLSDVTGTDAASVNGIPLVVEQVTATGVVVDLDTTGKTIVGTAAKLSGVGVELTVGYSYQAQDLIDALAAKERDVWLRFEGLNTAENQEPVVVDVFRLGIQPIAELALFGDAVQAETINGELMADNLRPAGSSQFYQVRKVGHRNPTI